jgi:hypothetical protein
MECLVDKPHIPEGSLTKYVLFGAAILASFILSTRFYAQNQMKYIKDHWSELRCNPAYMFLASQDIGGVDIFTNFNNCVTKNFHDYAGVTMDGMNDQMGTVASSLGSIGGSLSDMRGMFGDVRSSFMMIFQMVFGKIHNLMTSMQYLMIRIRTLMGRIVGVFASLIYVFYAGQQTGAAVWNGPVGTVARIL